jgi:uncharacterized protein YjiS (DUF1127 family)
MVTTDLIQPTIPGLFRALRLHLRDGLAEWQAARRRQAERRAGMTAMTSVGQHHRGIPHPVLKFLAGLSEGWTAYRRWAALNTLSDTQLARMGLSRGDVARYAILGEASARQR